MCLSSVVDSRAESLVGGVFRLLCLLELLLSVGDGDSFVGWIIIVDPYLCLWVCRAGGCVWSRFGFVAFCFIVWFSSHLAGGRGTGRVVWFV